MARWKKTPEETKAKVISLRMWNPNLSCLEIEEILKGTEFETSHDTVLRITEELRSVASSEQWKRQIERLDAIIWGIEDITHKVIIRVQESEDLSIKDVKDLNEISKTNWDRKRLLQWDSTENNKLTIEWLI